MSRPPRLHRPAEPFTRSPLVRIARAHLLAIDVDRPKRVDEYIDYFGGGGPRDRRHERGVHSRSRRPDRASPTR